MTSWTRCTTGASVGSRHTARVHSFLDRAGTVSSASAAAPHACSRPYMPVSVPAGPASLRMRLAPSRGGRATALSLRSAEVAKPLLPALAAGNWPTRNPAAPRRCFWASSTCINADVCTEISRCGPFGNQLSSVSHRRPAARSCAPDHEKRFRATRERPKPPAVPRGSCERALGAKAACGRGRFGGLATVDRHFFRRHPPTGIPGQR